MIKRIKETVNFLCRKKRENKRFISLNERFSRGEIPAIIRSQKKELRIMLNLLFTILMIMVFGKLIGFAIRAAWGISKVLVTLVFLPLILIGLGGLIYLALPILIVVGLVALFKGFD